MRGARWIALVVATMITGCARGSALVGTEWTLTDLGGSPAPSGPGTEATLSFSEAGRVSGRDSCNRFTGSLETGFLGNVKLRPIASTMMACGGGGNAQRTKYMSALESAERIALDGDTLLIYSTGLDKPLRFSRMKK
jgi:heat shock protein HslJ